MHEMLHLAHTTGGSVVRLLLRLSDLSSELRVLHAFHYSLFSWDVQHKLWENLNLVNISHEPQTLLLGFWTFSHSPVL
jgi:hypothetical protein